MKPALASKPRLPACEIRDSDSDPAARPQPPITRFNDANRIAHMLEDLEEDDEIEALLQWKTVDIAGQYFQAGMMTSKRSGFFGTFQSQNIPSQILHALQEHPGPATDLEHASGAIE